MQSEERSSLAFSPIGAGEEEGEREGEGGGAKEEKMVESRRGVRGGGRGGGETFSLSFFSADYEKESCTTRKRSVVASLCGLISSAVYILHKVGRASKRKYSGMIEETRQVEEVARVSSLSSVTIDNSITSQL